MHRSRYYQPVSLLLSALLISGCATKAQPLAPEVRKQLGKVYLNSAGHSGETFFHGNVARGSALDGASKGLSNSIEQCANSLMAGQLGILIFLVCTPILATTEIIKETDASAAKKLSPEALDNFEQQTSQVLQDADLSPALVATLDLMSQQDRRLETYDIAHGILPLPKNGEDVHEIAAHWGYQTVMEIEVTRIGLEGDNSSVPMLYLSMTARARLVQAGSGKKLEELEYHFDSKPQPVRYWVNDSTQLLTKAVTEANKTLARNIIDDVFIR